VRLAELLAIALAACGGSSSSPDAKRADARPPDAAHYDFGCAAGSACETTQVCCTMPGSATTFACVAPASCSASDQITCDGPDECGASAPVCCGVDVPDGTGQYPQCGIRSLGTSCTTASACQTHLGQSCTDTSRVQLCHVAADCTDPTNNMCCTFASGSASLTFCIDGTTASLGGATCH
jgi:hypothetical protein